MIAKVTVNSHLSMLVQQSTTQIQSNFPSSVREFDNHSSLSSSNWVLIFSNAQVEFNQLTFNFSEEDIGW